MIPLEFVLDSAVRRHPLAADRHLRVRHTSGTTMSEPLVVNGVNGQTVSLDETRPGRVEVSFTVRYTLDGHDYLLCLVRQVFALAAQPAGTLVPRFWMRGAGDVRLGVAVSDPPLHPLLSFDGIRLSLRLPFLDVTDLFMAIHGAKPWFRTLELLKSTKFRLRVLASLRGHPFVWYAVIPESALDASEITPHVFLWPADYGGIEYEAGTERGLRSRNHHRTLKNNQSGAESLCNFLLTPLDDERVAALAEGFARERVGFEAQRTDKNEYLPPPAYVYRRVLEYLVDKKRGELIPAYWNVPFGFEQAIAGTKQVLFFPQVAGGDGTHAIRPRLIDDLRAALAVMADRAAVEGPSFRAAAPAAGKIVISGYSQSGGNVFTAVRNNIGDVRGVVVVEPQYMNKRGDKESDQLALGSDVLPDFVKRGGKLVVVCRRREAWQRAKYVPQGVDPSRYTLLPSDLSVLDYPQLPTRPFFLHRYSRLLKPAGDAGIAFFADPSHAAADTKSRERIRDANAIITKRRRELGSDEALVRWVFAPKYDVDDSGGYYTHNFLIAAGEDDSAFLPDGRLKPGTRPRTFFERAVEIVLA